MSKLAIKVAGEAKPQGSKTGFINPRTGKVILTEASKGLKPWRQIVSDQVRLQAAAQNWQIAVKDQALKVRISFGLKQPIKLLRAHHTTKPDLDKLIRAILDGITQAGNVWADDSQVIELISSKHYSLQPAVEIEIAYV